MKTLKYYPSGNDPVLRPRHSRLATSFLRLVFLWTMSLCLFSTYQISLAQGVGISESSITPDASAILEARSTARGFLSPRMTTLQRDAIASPATGLMIFNTTTGQFNFYTGTAWTAFYSLNGLTATSQTFVNNANVTITSSGSTHTLGWSGQLSLSSGGTGASSFTSNALLIGNGTSALSSLSLGTANQILGMNSGGTANEYKTLSGTTNQINITNGVGSVTLSTPQNIHTAATPTFSGLTLSGLTGNSFLYSGTGGALTTTTAPTNGQLLIGSTGAVPVAATLTAGAGITITNAAGAITIANSADAGFSGNSRNSTLAISSTFFPNMTGTFGAATADAAAGTRNLVWRAGTIKNLYVLTSANPGAVVNTVTIMKNGVATTLTVTLNNVTSNNDVTHSFTVVAGDEIGVRIVTGAGTAVKWSWAVEFDK